MHYIFNNITFIIPEITLVLGAILTLLCGVFLKNKPQSSNDTLYDITNTYGAKNLLLTKHISLLSIAILITAAFFLTFLAKTNTVVFNNGIEVNDFTIFAKFLIIFAVCVNVIMIMASQELRNIPFEVFILILFASTGMMIIVSANDLLILYLGIELMSLSLYVLIAYMRDNNRASEAALKYFILGTLASGLYLFGSSMIYGFVGGINFDNISEYYFITSSETLNSGLSESTAMDIPVGFLVGITLIITALCFKMSAAPFHMWTPDVYQGSPTIITSFLATAPKITLILFTTKFLYQVLPDLGDEWQQIIIFASIASIAIGSFGAIVQQNIKRMLAYSAIGHIGFILLGLASNDFSGTHGAIHYAVIYLIMTITIFAILLTLYTTNEHYKTEIWQLAGLSKSNPYLSFAICILMFSMAGVPPFAGFFAKFFILFSLIKQELYPAAIFAVVCTVVSSFYYLRIIKIIYFDKNEMGNDSIKPAHTILSLIIILGVGFNILYIIIPEYISRYIEVAALKIWEYN